MAWLTVFRAPGSGINPRARSHPLVYNAITEKRFDQIAFRMINLHKKLPDREELRVSGLAEHEFIRQFCRLRLVDN